MDDILKDLNETELLWLARQQGLGHLRRDLDRHILESLVAGDIEIKPEHLANTAYTRKKLEVFIDKHWGVVSSQLPGCNGKCTTYPCTEARHLACLEPNREIIQ